MFGTCLDNLLFYIDGNLDRLRYISDVLKSMAVFCLQFLCHAIFQLENARLHVDHSAGIFLDMDGVRLFILASTFSRSDTHWKRLVSGIQETLISRIAKEHNIWIFKYSAVCTSVTVPDIQILINFKFGWIRAVLLPEVVALGIDFWMFFISISIVNLMISFLIILYLYNKYDFALWFPSWCNILMISFAYVYLVLHVITRVVLLNLLLLKFTKVIKKALPMF